jgi:hypothetical protein
LLRNCSRCCPTVSTRTATTGSRTSLYIRTDIEKCRRYLGVFGWSWRVPEVHGKKCHWKRNHRNHSALSPS